ncbi:MAG: acyl carrier protein [Promethearchaeota archaeon]|jgi:acyl carrier protein
MDADKVFLGVRKILADILQIEEEEISMEVSLFDDLGLESVDLLDLNFRIEKEFGIDIGVGEMWNIYEQVAEYEIIVEGKLTENGVELVKKLFSFADLSCVKCGMELYDIYSLITPKLLTDFVRMKMV